MQSFAHVDPVLPIYSELISPSALVTICVKFKSLCIVDYFLMEDGVLVCDVISIRVMSCVVDVDSVAQW